LSRHSTNQLGINNKGQPGESGSEMIGNMYVTGYPIVKDKVTFRIMSPKAPTSKPFGEMVFFQNLEELTNVHIEWEQAESDYNTKKNIILASEDYPDAFFSEGSLNTEDVAIYGPQGILIDLTDLLNKYGVNFNSLAQKDPVLYKLARYIDGKIYALPGVHGFDIDLININRIWISRVWLDKLNLNMPETIDDFYHVLKAFKTEDPNENGEADEIPFTFRFKSDLQGLGSLFGSFGRPEPLSHLLLDEETGKIIFTADKPEWKAAVSYLHEKMFREDLFDKEGFTQPVPQFFAKGRSEVQIIGSGSIFVANNLVGVDRVKDFPPLPPLKGPDGTTPMWLKQSELQTYYKTVSEIYGELSR
jgi:putative aldouronate transport system substrate-binding protein